MGLVKLCECRARIWSQRDELEAMIKVTGLKRERKKSNIKGRLTPGNEIFQFVPVVCTLGMGFRAC